MRNGPGGKGGVCRQLRAVSRERAHRHPRTGRRNGHGRERLKTWSKKAAVESNKVVRNFGIERRGLVENEPSGYIAAFLDGIWLRAPYMQTARCHQCAICLNRPPSGPKYSTAAMTFTIRSTWVSSLRGEEAEQVGTRYDVSERASGNQGHEYGTNFRRRKKTR